MKTLRVLLTLKKDQSMKRFRITHYDLQRVRRRLRVSAPNCAAALAQVDAMFGEGWFYSVRTL